MVKRDRKVYMRAYRARKREGVGLHIPIPKSFTGTDEEVIDIGAQRILALEEEVRQLKRELTARPPTAPAERSVPNYVQANNATAVSDPYSAFRPVPKPIKRK